jgi:hypothetical protein
MDLKGTFDGLDAATLDDWVSSQKQEDLHLDFKLMQSAPDFGRDDRKNLAKALSGFANSDGGLIAWGIDGRKNAECVDCAVGVVPVSNVGAVLSKLQSLTGEATVPIVDGVVHRIVPVAAGGGVVITYVPPSEAGPHMAMLGENRYYKRSGDSFYQMEHFDIADMFGRRVRPRLALSLSLTTGGASSGGGGRSAKVQAVVGIENSGRGLARFPLLRIRPSTPYAVSPYELDGNGRSGLPVLVRSGSEPNWAAYAGGVDSVVHPGTTLDITLVRADVHESMSSFPDLLVEYVLAAEGVLPSIGRQTVSGVQVLQLARELMEKSFSKG